MPKYWALGGASAPTTAGFVAATAGQRLATTRLLPGLLWAFAAFGTMACEPVAPVAPARLAQGVYCLAEDVDVDLAAADAFGLGSDTTLDCRGHRIRDVNLTTGHAVAAHGASNVRIQNCIFEGFGRAIWLQGAIDFRITDNTFLKTMDIGVFVDGEDGLISRNVFRYPETRMTGSAVYGRGSSVAIEAHGTADIIGNTITAANADTTSWGDRAGIWSAGNHGGVIAFNVIRGLVPGPDFWRYGIVAGGTPAIYRNTTVSTGPVAYDDAGISCELGGAPIPLQNVILGYSKAYLQCAGAGEVGLRAGLHRR